MVNEGVRAHEGSEGARLNGFIDGLARPGEREQQIGDRGQGGQPLHRGDVSAPTVNTPARYFAFIFLMPANAAALTGN